MVKFVVSTYLCFTNVYIILDNWKNSWIYSKHPGKEFGKFVRSSGRFYRDENVDKGKQIPTNIVSIQAFYCYKK